MKKSSTLVRISILTILLAGSSLAVTACSKSAPKAPDGQVVAKLAGKDITQLEVEEELRRMSPPADMEKHTAERIALQNIIARRMLANAAEKQGLDKTPEFIMAERRAKEQLRVEALAQSVRQSVPQPSGDEVSNFINQNPDLFRDHKVYALDQIQFLQADDMNKLGLKDLHSMDAVAAALTANNIQFQRKPATMDSLAVQPDFLKNVTDLHAKQPGEPFLFTRAVENAPRPVVFVNTIVSTQVIPFTGKPAEDYAKNRLYTTRIQDALQKKMKEEREAAKKIVVYQNGWEPDEDQEIDARDVTQSPKAPAVGDGPAASGTAAQAAAAAAK